MKTRSPVTSIATSLIATLLSTSASFAIDLVNWDIPTAAATSALTSSVTTGLSASAISLSGLNLNSAGSLWRTRGYTDTTTRYITFSITAAPGNTVTLESLIFTANAQAGTGAAWTAPTLRLDHSTDSTFASGVVAAGSLSLGPDLAASTGTPVTATSATFLATDLVINAGQTYYFRLVGLGANSATQNMISYNSANDMQITGTVVSSSANLVWAGADGASWNTSESNFTKDGNPSTFASNDNVTIQTSGGIAIDAAGITAGSLTHTTASGSTTLTTGSLTATSLVKSGAGTLAVSSPVSLSTGLGSSAVSGGVFQILDGASLTTTGLNLSGGATIEIASTATFSTSGANTLGTGGGTFSNDSNITLASISNSIINNPFTKSGGGVLTLTGIGTPNTGPVDLDITAGSIIANGPVGSARQINIGGANVLNGDLTLNGPVLMLHGSAVTGTGSIIANGSTSSITSRFNAGVVNVNVPITLNTSANIDSPDGGNNLFFNSPITGAFGLTKKGNGLVVLAAANDYTTTTIEAGTLRLDTGGSLGSGDVAITTNLQFNQGDVITVANTLSGAGTVRMSGGGSVTLSGANSYTGVTTVSAGTLNAPDLTDGFVPGSIGEASGDAEFIVLNGGTLAHTGAATTCDRLFTVGILGGTLAANGSGPLNMAGLGDVAVSEPAPAAVGNLTIGTRYKIVTTGDTDFTLIGAANSDPDTVFTATGPGTGTGTVVYANTRGFGLTGTAPGTSVLAATIIDAANAPTSLTKNGTNTWSVTAANTYTGDTLVTEGTLRISQPYLANSSAIAIGAAATLDLNFDETGGDVTDTVDRLTINDVGQPAGVYGATGSGATTLNNTNFAGVGTLTVLNGPVAGDTYADWAVDNGIGAAAFNDDFDNDGIANGVEYALGKNPTISSQPPGVLTGNTITFTKGAEAITNADVSWIIEISETLVAESWASVVTQAAGSTDPTIEYTFTPGTPVKEFARLKVVQAD
ncbi:MAG: autotransporter-associated beta strand repeat-containing protein [Akkermansiaceae bacterium]